jgi:hypothetical protein
MRDYLPKLRGKYRVWSIVFLSAITAWTIGPLVLWTISRPSVVWMLTVGFPIQYGGLTLIFALSVGVLYLFRAPLRAKAAQLRTADNAVFCITLDPQWMPVGSSSDVLLGPGFLIVEREGIRIVDDADHEVLVAAWGEVVGVRPSRAPKPIAELEIDRDGEITRWWFYVFGPAAFRRRGRRGINRFVSQVDALRPKGAA